MTTSATRLNDVDISAVGSLINAIEEQPEVANTVWKASVDWNGGFRSESRIRDFGPVASDEPPALGGGDTAPNPVEQLLAALGNCLAVGYAANATAAGIQLNELRIDLDGDLDLRTFLGLADGHAGFQAITARVTIGADAPADEVEALHRKVVSTSPVGHTLQKPIPISVELV